MKTKLLPANVAAERLGIIRATLYGWLNASNAGSFSLRGAKVTIEYLQGGARGQGRILISSAEVERLKDLMRVHPQRTHQMPAPKSQCYPHITVKLGRPDD